MSDPVRLRPPLSPAQQQRARSATRFANKLAARLAAQLGRNVDDIASVANEALLDAARTYDPEMGTKFTTHVWSRVRGEVFDTVTKERAHSGDGLLRALRRAGHAVAETIDDEGNVLEDTDEVTVSRMEMACDEVLAGVLAGFGCRMDAANAEMELVEAQTEAGVLAALRGAVGSLEDADARLVELHYGRELALEAVAQELGLSYRTARRRHREVLDRLAKRLRAAGVPPS